MVVVIVAMVLVMVLLIVVVCLGEVRVVVNVVMGDLIK